MKKRLLSLVMFSFMGCAVVLAEKDPIDEFESRVEEQIDDRIVKEAKAAAGQFLPDGLVITVEFIEVELMDFSDWMLENPIMTDATPLRREVQVWVKAGKGKIVESMTVHARSGQRAKVESVHEVIYPTEYDPPTGAATAQDGENVKLVPPSAVAFETRNVGTTFEVDPVVGADGDVVDLNLAPEIVQMGENTQHVTTLGDVEMTVDTPHFMTSKVTTQVSVRPGDYSFLGTSRLGIPELPDADDPILLMFIRCDVSGY
tara:strand:+ start:200 stop:976 length:777 start_codon:yes stop_codon:yes gene_type:complete